MTPRSLLLVVAVAAMIGLPHAAPAQEKAAAKVTFDDDVRPILREHCFICHNQNQSKGGLALDSYARTLEGGASGEVVFDGDLESSRLWSLVAHLEEPVMPPGQDKLADAKLNVIKAWIEGGLLENAGSKAKAKKTSSVALAPSGSGNNKPEGPAAMPEGLWRQPTIHTERPAAVSAVASSPWAPLVAVAGQRQIALYDSDHGQLLGILPFPEGIAYSLRFSRNGDLLLAGGGRGGSSGCAVLYDVRTGRRLLKVGEEYDAVLAADINNDHSRIALGGPGRIVRIYSTTTGELLHEIRKHTDWVYAIRFSPDGVLLATADRSNGLFVWEADTAREYLNLTGHTAAVTDVSWRPDSNILASCSSDGTVRLWEMNDGKSIKRWNAHGGGAESVAYTHDGHIATAGRDRRAKLWDGNGKGLKTFPATQEAALEVCFTHDGKRVVCGDWTGAVNMWQTDDGKLAAQLPPNPPTLAMRVEAAAKQLAAAQAKANQAQLERQAVEQRVAKAEQAVTEATQRMQSARQLVAQTRKSLGGLEQQLRTAAAELTKLRKTRDAAIAQNKQALDAKQAAEDAAAAAQQQDAATVNKLDAAKQRVEETKAALATADQAWKNADTQHQKLQQNADVARKSIAATEQRIKTEQQQISKMTKVQKDAEKPLAEKVALHDAAAAQHAAAKKALEQWRAEMARFDAAPQQLEQAAVASAAQATQTAAAVETLVARQTELQAALQKLREQQQALEASLSGVRRESQQAQQAAENAQQKAADAAARAKAFHDAYGK
jgi:hypothetical protein